ncbi:hypothetical protein H6501_04035 [Candidatus Woesearchaeota archaeon]|nr:hypothetical protein [Nanoarchaeota archaeon]MCB9370742.1 hypothetical protein [Candidatus Woesearchaeota archaeon]
MVQKVLKKASEKPIEIFVSLFVILAVAMVLLKMFSGGVSDRQNQLNQQAAEEEAKQICTTSCSQAKANNCRTEDVIAYCVKSFSLDWDGNSDNGNGEADTGTFTMCEDSIYCPLVQKCDCGVELSMDKCLEITAKFYNDHEGYTQTMFDDKFTYSKTGQCTEGDGSWRKLYGFESQTIS